MNEEEDRGKARNRSFIQLAKLSSVGLELGIAITIGWAFGNWLDGKLGTRPYLMIVFLLFGVVAGFRGVYRAAREASRPSKESKDQE